MKIIKIKDYDINLSLIEYFRYIPQSLAKKNEWHEDMANTEKEASLQIHMSSGKSFTVNGEEATVLHDIIMKS